MKTVFKGSRSPEIQVVTNKPKRRSANYRNLTKSSAPSDIGPGGRQGTKACANGQRDADVVDQRTADVAQQERAALRAQVEAVIASDAARAWRNYRKAALRGSARAGYWRDAYVAACGSDGGAR